MENFSQVESNILNRIKNISDRNSLDLVKTEIFGKNGFNFSTAFSDSFLYVVNFPP